MRAVSTTRRSRLATRAAGAAGVALLVAVAACGGDSGGSLTDAGNDSTTAAPTSSLAPGETTTTAAPSTTVATPLDELPPCPVDALDAASGPVKITFWHGMTSNLEKELQKITKAYNNSQDRVQVELQNQGGYESVIDKYLQSSTKSRPELVQAPEYSVKVFADSGTFIPVGACVESSGFDMSGLLPAALNQYSAEGVLWSMPFNMSNPILYYNRKDFVEAGLDPDAPPKSLEELRDTCEKIVAAEASTYCLALDTNFDSGGGWFIEQWFAKAAEFYADNQNGRSAPATEVLFNGQAGVDMMTFLQDMVNDGLAVNVGDNTSGQDTFLKIADPTEPATMTIGTSAALGTVLDAVEAGIAGPDIKAEDIGIGQMPGPNGSPNVLVGGASLWIPADKGDAEAAAAWDFITYLASPEVQSEWGSATGYVPVNEGALQLDPLKTTYAENPKFRVAYDSIHATPGDDPTAVGPLLGPQREIRVLTSTALAEILNGGDVQEALDKAAQQADSLLADYNSRS